MNVDAKFAKNAGVNLPFVTYGYEIKKKLNQK